MPNRMRPLVTAAVPAVADIPGVDAGQGLCERTGRRLEPGDRQGGCVPGPGQRRQGPHALPAARGAEQPQDHLRRAGGGCGAGTPTAAEADSVCGASVLAPHVFACCCTLAGCAGDVVNREHPEQGAGRRPAAGQRPRGMAGSGHRRQKLEHALCDTVRQAPQLGWCIIILSSSMAVDSWLPPHRHIQRKLGFSTSNTVDFSQTGRDFHGLAEGNHAGTAADRPASELGRWLQKERAS